jgi:hypothetical protein
MRERVERFLRERFNGMIVDFGPPADPERRLSGVLVWKDFEEMTVAQRQDLVWNALREEFGPDSAQVSTIVTVTPGQYDTLAAGKEAE